MHRLTALAAAAGRKEISEEEKAEAQRKKKKEEEAAERRRIDSNVDRSLGFCSRIVKGEIGRMTETEFIQLCRKVRSTEVALEQ